MQRTSFYVIDSKQLYDENEDDEENAARERTRLAALSPWQRLREQVKEMKEKIDDEPALDKVKEMLWNTKTAAEGAWAKLRLKAKRGLLQASAAAAGGAGARGGEGGVKTGICRVWSRLI